MALNICATCKSEFKTRHYRKFCSITCRVKAHVITIKPCDFCKTEFVLNSTQRSKFNNNKQAYLYCSHDCRAKGVGLRKFNKQTDEQRKAKRKAKHDRIYKLHNVDRARVGARQASYRMAGQRNAALEAALEIQILIRREIIKQRKEIK